MVSTDKKNLDISQVTGTQELVRMLAKLRLRSDPQATAKGITEDVVDRFSETEIKALPESTIVHIADAYFILNRKGLPDQEIFNRIDMQRSLLRDVAALPADTNLSKYIKWRLKAEFPHLALEDMIVDMQILYVVKWFSRGVTANQSWANADAFAAKAISTIRGKYRETEGMPTIEEGAGKKASAGKWKWIAFAMLAVSAVGATSYWLFFMGGMKVIGH